ncbi:hypothetical protein [Paenactinomyces guangxiensis]|uniref:hypothetical protein n=1 Tax=Paenactinomyces guangxiensis TaxID=1490290 RepID=UPI001E5DFEA0|nr:hypothetical protein [Paenactinomyces guangxiensis]
MYLSGWMILWWGGNSVFLAAAILNLLVVTVFVRTRLWKTDDLSNLWQQLPVLAPNFNQNDPREEREIC